MTSLMVSKERLAAIVMQAYQCGYNKRDQRERNTNQIQVGSQNNGRKKHYFVISDDMSFESCPKVSSNAIDCFDMTNVDGLGLVLAYFDDLVDGLLNKD